jgi:hypothetical protein
MLVSWGSNIGRVYCITNHITKNSSGFREQFQRQPLVPQSWLWVVHILFTKESLYPPSLPISRLTESTEWKDDFVSLCSDLHYRTLDWPRTVTVRRDAQVTTIVYCIQNYHECTPSGSDSFFVFGGKRQKVACKKKEQALVRRPIETTILFIARFHFEKVRRFRFILQDSNCRSVDKRF